MNIMLETANLDNHPYLSGCIYADGSEESIFFCPKCAKNGTRNKLVYDPATSLLTCCCQDCPGEYTHKEYAEAAFEAMSRAAEFEDEFGDERMAWAGAAV